MKLWSLQPLIAKDILLRGEDFICDPSLSELYGDLDFKRSYAWIAQQLALLTPKPAGVKLPIWAWHKNYGAVTKPDRRKGLFRDYRSDSVLIELSVPDELVLLSDFDDWHYVLNDWPLEEADDSHNDNYDEIYDKYKNYTAAQKSDSWQEIFSVAHKKNVQACFWSIKPEYVVKYHKIRSSVNDL